jgi:hypothetical protein
VVSNVHILCAAAPTDGGFAKGYLDAEQMLASARADRFGLHTVVDDPAAADLVLFVETSWTSGYYFQSVRRHPVYRAFKPKCYLFSATDKAVPFLPGVYASIERRWYWPSWTRAGFFPGVKEGDSLRYEAGCPPSYLFSFVGAANAHRVRRRIMALDQRDALLVDTHAEAAEAKQSKLSRPGFDEHRRSYARSITDSFFVLCPRGGGASTFRLFETMMLGRVPVIVSDQWVPPVGPDWSSFSLRVRERDVGLIPALLEKRVDDAAVMGEKARQAWLGWFSESSAFHRTVEWCCELQVAAGARAGSRAYAPYLQMLRPYHAARWVAKQLGHGSGRQA